MSSKYVYVCDVCGYTQEEEMPQASAYNEFHKYFLPVTKLDYSNNICTGCTGAVETAIKMAVEHRVALYVNKD